jgi:hypothetical protein
MYTSKCIAYGLSHTIVYIGKSEPHAIRSTNWIKKQVEHNGPWISAFGIKVGSKWQDTEFEIIVGPDEIPVWIMAAGINGSIRGINRDDFRPDLIVLDDVLDDENAHTHEQRDKISKLVYGALQESLAPKIEAPHAKMIALNTPQHREDFSVKALKDPGWVSAVYGCWTKATANMPLEYQVSSWEERYPTADLREEKRIAAHRNMLPTFLREKECKLVSSETASFKLPWLRKYAFPPEKFIAVYAIDPVPPPSETEVEKEQHKNDFEAHVVWGVSQNKVFLLDYAQMRGHEPTWTIKTFFEMQRKWHPLCTRVETTAYQRTLMWILRTAMDKARSWYAIEEWPPKGSTEGKQPKYVRIVNAHNGLASQGRMYCREDQVDFIEAFATYPKVTNDDLLDASSIALMKIIGMERVEEDTTSPLGKVDDVPGYKQINVYAAP